MSFPTLRTAAFWLLAWGLPAKAISISLYVAAPGVASSPATGGIAFDETFNDTRIWPRGISHNKVPKTTGIGTFQLSDSSGLYVWASNLYGGAEGTNYAAVGTRPGTPGPVTLDLAQPAPFFGLWWSAIDPFNGISFYSGHHFLLRLTGADMNALLGASPTLTAQNGATYPRSDYLGKPGTNPLQNPTEYYAYTIFRIHGAMFTRVVFDNSDTNRTGFEMDNLQIRVGNFTIPDTTVLLARYDIQPVPEPSYWIPVAAGWLWLARLQRKKSSPASDTD